MDFPSDSGDIHAGRTGVIIKTFATRGAAELAVSQLEANDIACWIKADDCGGLLPSLSLAEGVHVVVSPADAEEARNLLALSSPSSVISPLAPETPSPPPRPRSGKLAIGQIFIGIVIGIVVILFYQWANNPGRVTHNHYTADGKLSDTWNYDGDVLVSHFEDRNLDGVFDHWAYFDKHGRVDHSQSDNNFDGKPDETWTYSNGELLTMEKDTDFNGVSDEFCTYKYSIIQHAEVRPNGSQFATKRDLYANGILTEIWSGGDANGIFKEVVKYDPFFNPISTNTGSFPLLSTP
jgi:hypothetical protein